MRTRTVKWVVNFGYAGAFPLTYSDEASARASYLEQSIIPSYLDERLKQPAELIKIVTITEVLETNRA